MSFAEKITSLMQRPNEDLVPKDEVPWWMRYGGRALGTVGGGLTWAKHVSSYDRHRPEMMSVIRRNMFSPMAILCGLWNVVGIVFINFSCAFAGVFQMVAGFMVIVIEAPCCCFFIDYVQVLSDFVEKRPYWNKAVLYMGVAIPPVLFCFGPTSFFGSALIFGTGVIYGLMALGKKATQEEMRQNAAVNNTKPTSSFAGIRSSSNLVENAQPISFTGTPIPPV